MKRFCQRGTFTFPYIKFVLLCLNMRWETCFLYLICRFFRFSRLNDFKEFADVIEAVKDKGVVVAVASPDDIDAANKSRPEFFQVKNAL